MKIPIATDWVANRSTGNISVVFGPVKHLRILTDSSGLNVQSGQRKGSLVRLGWLERPSHQEVPNVAGVIRGPEKGTLGSIRTMPYWRRSKIWMVGNTVGSGCAIYIVYSNI